MFIRFGDILPFLANGPNGLPPVLVFVVPGIETFSRVRHVRGSRFLDLAVIFEVKVFPVVESAEKGSAGNVGLLDLKRCV